MTSFHEGMSIATLTPDLGSSNLMDGELKVYLWAAGQNYESSHLGSLTEDPVLGVE